MSIKFPQFQFTNKEVVVAGIELKNDISWEDEGRREEIKRTFQIANSWCNSHLYPMVRIRAALTGRMRALELDGLTVGRLKTMKSVRRKLKNSNLRLNQIQDLGGCRSIVTDIDAANNLAESLKSDLKYNFLKENDYIASPKSDGYRCRHLIFGFSDSANYPDREGRRIEIQVRTRLQHSWATAVEVMGTFLGQYLKGGMGDKRWLRLFQLMSGEVAIAEKCPVGPHLPPRNKYLTELRTLEKELSAVKTLESIAFAVEQTNRISTNPKDRPAYYLVSYDIKSGTVRVNGYNAPIFGAHAFRDAEMQQLDSEINTVLIEADKVETLKEAYPNYFGDVNVFCTNLKAVTQGTEAVEYTMPPRLKAPPQERETPDLRWFSQPRYRRWK